MGFVVFDFLLRVLAQDRGGDVESQVLGPGCF